MNQYHFTLAAPHGDSASYELRRPGGRKVRLCSTSAEAAVLADELNRIAYGRS